MFRPANRFRAVAAFLALAALSAAPAFAQEDGAPQTDVFSKIKLCPATVAKTCFIGYVTDASKVLVLMSSDSQSALGGTEVEVASAPDAGSGATAVTPLDLSAAKGRVVLLDGNGGDRIYGAKLVQTADELLTALYLSVFFGADQGPPADEEVDVPPLTPPDGSTGQPQ